MNIDQIRQQMLAAHTQTDFSVGFKVPRAPMCAESIPAMIFGMRVHTSPLCVRQVPVRVHKQRMLNVRIGGGLLIGTGTYPERGNYHKRIQKKWNKRYGFKDEHSVFIINGGRDVYMHPEAHAKLILEAERLK